VRTHFNSIYSALSAQPYRVCLCGAFWAATNTGTDSLPGTLKHETSHFSVVAAS
jgi:peptidyl-Lys metalloendopeptidase